MPRGMDKSHAPAREGFQAGSNINIVTINLGAIEHHIAGMNAHAEQEFLVVGDAVIFCGDFFLRLDSRRDAFDETA